jgi:hypothetical protein
MGQRAPYLLLPAFAHLDEREGTAVSLIGGTGDLRML